MTPRRPQRDYHKHPIILTAAGAIALAQLLTSIEGTHQ